MIAGNTNAVSTSEKSPFMEKTMKTAAALEIRTPFYAIAVLYLTLPNLPLLLSTRTLGALPHGYINLEYLLIGALGVFMPRGAVFMLLLLESLADFAYSVCYTYQFSLENLLSSLRYLPLLPMSRILEGLVFLATGILFCAALAFVRPLPRRRLWTAGVLLACVAILAPIDIFCGQNPIWHKDVALSPYRVTRSPIFTLGVREAAARFTNKKESQANDAPMRSASSPLISFFDKQQDPAEFPNVVLVVVESWGLALDSHLAQQLTAPYDDPRIALKYNVSYGTAPFTGLTVPGEARELCQSTIGFGILNASSGLVGRCLPAFFHARGYRNLAIHGYVGQMFYRGNWYAKLGFDRMWFGPNLHQMGLPNCRGAFPGVCDASIAGWMGSSLLSADQGKPQFIYWVTLNSHLPVPAHPDLADDGVCATQPALRNSAALCSWFRLVRVVHESVQQVALRATARPTIFILVGDHAPPFGDPRLRAEFSGTEVPYVMLTPRQKKF
jgi:phosphoglycerol transferase MdoB-like AlkP superfamily enzyme